MAESDSAWKHITIYLYIVIGIFSMLSSLSTLALVVIHLNKALELFPISFSSVS